MAQPTATDIGDAVLVALARHAAGAVLWIAWLIARRPIDAPPGPISLVILFGMVALYVLWVNKPLERALGSLYAKRPHWSGLFVLPTVFSIVMLILDVVRLVRAALGS